MLLYTYFTVHCVEHYFVLGLQRCLAREISKQTIKIMVWIIPCGLGHIWECMYVFFTFNLASFLWRLCAQYVQGIPSCFFCCCYLVIRMCLACTFMTHALYKSMDIYVTHPIQWVHREGVMRGIVVVIMANFHEMCKYVVDDRSRFLMNQYISKQVYYI